jgi:hypothetical protein
MTTLERLLIGLVLWAGSLGAVAWWAYNKGDDHATAAADRDYRIAKLARDAAQQGAAEAIASNRPKNVTIRQEVEREIQTNVQYRDCVHSPEQLRRLNAAITGDEPEPAGSGLVPKAGAAGGWLLRRNDGQAGGSLSTVP